MAKQVRQAKRRFRQLDGRFVAVLKDIMPPDEYADFQRYMKQQRDRNNEAAGAG
jgi:hypothetical protein